MTISHLFNSVLEALYLAPTLDWLHVGSSKHRKTLKDTVEYLITYIVWVMPVPNTV
jgi:hypothetical protein